MGNSRNVEGSTKPVLTVQEAAGVTRGVALVLHGGRSHSYEPVEARHLSPARMVPFAKQLHRAGSKHGLAVWTLRNSVRGWNGPDMSPLQDARWALARIHEEHPGVPVYLLGHSMGGLTAICAADDPQVDAVVALAPWLNAETPAGNVAGRKVLIVHGSRDRWTSPAQSLKFARRAADRADELHYVSLAGAGHFMFRKVGLWHALATGFVLKAFAETTGAEPGGAARFDALLPATSPGIPVVL
ncbi:alpha/beta hydrolase [Arthrobacter sp. B10-11]|uniref:alpha/beta hydrolase n=1 Tax=Arthrobacter sp. B10-11 TaxID=3081160 RepID=UPI002953010E|nr:alpha/beta fold hydrolase [Arthrobacter sp. B10-11]MDV8149388.1 alpha/beta fold hydrolase [Arthrobacter sp. B10-11]